MERTRRNEQHMVGFHRAIFGGDSCAFNQWQQVALNAFAADGASAPRVRHSNLINFVKKYDAIGFRVGKCHAVDVILV